MTSLLLLVIAIVSALGWWRAMQHWQRALDRERLLLEVVRKCIAHLPTIAEDLRDMDTHPTRH